MCFELGGKFVGRRVAEPDGDLGEREFRVQEQRAGGVDPAAREFIMRTILNNYREGATIIISTHLIRDIEEILDEYIFINRSHLVSYGSVKEIHKQNKTVDELFREVFRCYPAY